MSTSSPPSARRPSDLAEHRLLGDGAGAALVRSDAAIDWWCGPSFASPPVFWALLDPAGGVAGFGDAQPDWHDDRPAGPTTTTTVRLSGQRIMVRDGYVDRRLIRLVSTPDGALDAVHGAALGGFGTVGGPPYRVETMLRLDPRAALEIRPDSVGRLDPAEAAMALDGAEASFEQSTGHLELPGWVRRRPCDWEAEDPS